MEEKTNEKIVIQKPPKSPALAGILAFFFPGTGALYNRQVLKGILFIIVFAGLVSMQHHGDAQPFIALILAGFYIFQIIDSVQTSKSVNHRYLKGEKEIEEAFSEEFTAGSIFWGIFLIILGGVLLLANFEVISYGVLFDFWPLAVIGIGAKLIYDSSRKKNGS